MSINRNLKKATDITNRNIKAFAEWNVDAMHSQTNWLADKIDYLDLKLDIFSGKNKKPILMEVGAKMFSMVQEIQGFAQKATFDGISRNTARSSLRQFVATAEHLAGDASNITKVVTVLKQVTSLHSTLHSAAGRRSKTSSMRSLLQQGVDYMQQSVQRQMATIGVYKHHSVQSQEKTRAWSALHAWGTEVLVELDKIWWRLRGGLDEYLQQAEGQVEAFRGAFDALAEYRQCSSGFSDLRAKYNHALYVRSASHEKLRKAWHESVNLLGELASTIVDGEAFSTFFAEEGCDSPLAVQTLEQARSAVVGIDVLLHRFEAGGLPPPDLEPLAESASRIQGSFNESKTTCMQGARHK